jgi:Tol biopolymer transport system component
MADVFVRDLQTGQTTRVSVSSTGAQGNEMSGLFTLSISGDGRYAVFESAASNLVEGDTNGVDDVFLHDMQTGGTARLSASASGEQGNAFSGDPAISADGHYAVFQSGADNLVNDDADDSGSLFITPVLPVFIKLYLPLIYR